MSLERWHHLSKRALEAAGNRKAMLGRRAPAGLLGAQEC